MVTEGKSLLAEYHDILQEKLEGRRGEFLYRGQENADWQLRSGAVRRIFFEEGDRGREEELQKLIEEHKRDFDFHKENLHYHEELLGQAKLRGWHYEVGGRKLGDLEILAKLQHYGAATCLLDFTTRFDIALWFACQEVQGEEDKERDGKLFIVDINNISTPILRRIGPDDLKHSIGEFLRFEAHEKNSKFWYWHPETLMGRMLSQESRFLFGPKDVSDSNQEERLFLPPQYLFSIKVKQKHKEQLLEELNRHCGLNRRSIFSDIHGFVTVNNHRTSFQKKDYVQEGKEKIEKGDFLGAIEDLNVALELDEKNATTWLHLGSANFCIGVEKQEQERRQKQTSKQVEPLLTPNKYHRESVKNFSKAIRLKSDYADAYAMRSGAYIALGKFDKARSDLKVLQGLYEREADQRGKEFVEVQFQRLDNWERLYELWKAENELPDS